MPTLERALAACEDKLADAQKAADKLVKNLRRARNAAKVGNVADLEKSLQAVSQYADEAVAVASSIETSWDFDARAHLADGGYLKELLAESAQAGTELFEKAGRIYCFPVLMRIDPGEIAIRIGTKVERRIRPRELVRQLRAMQQRPQRFREQQFLDLLYKTYQRVTGRQWKDTKQGLGPVVPVADLHNVLTLMPGTGYPIEEFGRDLLLLDRKPDLRTRDHSSFQFLGSTMSRERVQRVAVYDEKGSERTYIGIAFVRET